MNGRITSEKYALLTIQVSRQVLGIHHSSLCLVGKPDLMYVGEAEAAQENMRTVPDYVLNLKKSLVESYAAVRETLGTKLQRQKDFYCRRVHGDPQNTGDFVMLFSPVVPK